MDGFRQSTNVGESLRSTGHLVTWRPPIRLWKDVLNPLWLPFSWRALDTSLSS